MSWMVPGRLPQEGPEPILGAGVSRPHEHEKTKPFRVEVKRPGAQPMRVVIPAATRAKAVKYCKNRWPDATVTPIK